MTGDKQSYNGGLRGLVCLGFATQFSDSGVLLC